MAITKTAWQTHRSRTGYSTDGSRVAEEYFVIYCDTDTTTTEVEGLNGMPVYGSSHPVAPLFCNTVEYSPMDENSRQIFGVRAQYTDDFETNPLSEPPDIEWDFSEDGDQPYFLDCTPPGTGTPQPPTSSTGPLMVTNSAGERFEDFLTRAGGSITATFSINVPPNQAASLAQTLVGYTYPVPSIDQNGFTFDGLTIATGQALIKGGTIGGVTKVKINGSYVYYRSVKYSLAFKKKWDDIVDDRGYNETWDEDPSGNTTLMEIVKGLPPVKPDRPWPLDGDGGSKDNVTDAPAQLTFKPYPQNDFSVFNFQ